MKWRPARKEAELRRAKGKRENYRIAVEEYRSDIKAHMQLAHGLSVQAMPPDQCGRCKQLQVRFEVWYVRYSHWNTVVSQLESERE